MKWKDFDNEEHYFFTHLFFLNHSVYGIPILNKCEKYVKQQLYNDRKHIYYELKSINFPNMLVFRFSYNMSEINQMTIKQSSLHLYFFN